MCWLILILLHDRFAYIFFFERKLCEVIRMYICFRCKNYFVNNGESFVIFWARLLCRMSPGVFSWKELPKWQFSPSAPIFYFTPPHFIFSFVPLFISYINYFIFIYLVYIKTHTSLFLSLHPGRILHRHRQHQQFPVTTVAGIFSGNTFYLPIW